MLIFQTKDFGRIACHTRTAFKFPVLRKILKSRRSRNCISVDFISGVTLQTLLTCAERPSDLEHCSHNAKELSIIPNHGRVVRCTSETLKELIHKNLLDLEAELEYTETGHNEADDSNFGKYLVHLRLKEEVEADSGEGENEQGEDDEKAAVAEAEDHKDFEESCKKYKPLCIYCALDAGTVRCQLATAKKFAVLRPHIEALQEDDINRTVACWSPALQIHLEHVKSKTLAALITCAERPEDFEPCSHNVALRNNIAKIVCIDHATLTDIIENDQFGVDGKITFTVAKKKGFYYLSVQLLNEGPSLRNYAESSDPLMGLIHRYRLRTFTCKCKDGDVKFLRRTIKKCPALADCIHCEAYQKSTVGSYLLRNVTSKALRLFFDLAVRREDFQNNFRRDSFLEALIPEDGQTRLVDSKLLSNLIEEKILFINCKLCCAAGTINGYYNIRLLWQWEPGYQEASRRHFSLMSKTLHLRPQTFNCIVECAHDKLVELPSKFIQRFPTIHAQWKLNKTSPVKLPIIRAIALRTLIDCALNEGKKLKVHANVLYEIFHLKDKSFHFKGKLKFEPDDEYEFLQISVDWHKQGSSKKAP